MQSTSLPLLATVKQAHALLGAPYTARAVWEVCVARALLCLYIIYFRAGASAAVYVMLTICIASASAAGYV